MDVFESLLEHHPNPLFVQSICAGLHEGFWPWADTKNGVFPSTHDESRPTPADDKQASFLRDQCLKERQKGRFSDSFGSKLLPGMFSMPVHAVLKPNSDDLRMVMDHSAGPFSLNNMIDHSQVTGFPLDNLRHLGEMLLDVQHSSGNLPLTLWKSDISDVYRLLPMHPLWQLKQYFTLPHQSDRSPIGLIGLRSDSEQSELSPIRVRAQSELSPIRVQAQSELSPIRVRAQSELSLIRVRSESELSLSSVPVNASTK